MGDAEVGLEGVLRAGGEGTHAAVEGKGGPVLRLLPGLLDAARVLGRQVHRQLHGAGVLRRAERAPGPEGGLGLPQKALGWEDG